VRPEQSPDERQISDAAARRGALDRWLDSYHEESLEPDLPIVDPHHHLWDRGGHTYRLPQFRADIGGSHNIRASVFVECLSHYRADGPRSFRVLGETAFVVDEVQSDISGAPLVQAMVGAADLMLGAEVEAVLDAQIETAAGLLRGIRYASAWDASPAIHSAYPTVPHILGNARFREGFARLVPHGLIFEAWVYFTQLLELSDIAAAFPETVIVLDHLGGPIGVGPYAGTRADNFEIWRRGISALAQHQNVHVKLGGLAMKLAGFGFDRSERPVSSQTLAAAWRPYVETCIMAFGPGRCMFESNFPIDKASCSYGVLWNAFKRIVAGASKEEKNALFAGTAARVYSLTP